MIEQHILIERCLGLRAFQDSFSPYNLSFRKDFNQPSLGIRQLPLQAASFCLKIFLQAPKYELIWHLSRLFYLVSISRIDKIDADCESLSSSVLDIFVDVGNRDITSEELFIRVCMGWHRLQWDDPYGGRGIDTFTLTNDSRTLVHKTSIIFDDQAKNCTYRWAHQNITISRPLSLLYKALATDWVDLVSLWICLPGHMALFRYESRNDMNLPAKQSNWIFKECLKDCNSLTTIRYSRHRWWQIIRTTRLSSKVFIQRRKTSEKSEAV